MTDTLDDAPRVAGLRGRLPAEEHPEMPVADVFMVTPIPAPTLPIDVSGGVPASLLGMLANGPDSTLTITTANGPGGPVGDCYFAGTVHLLRVVAAVLKL